MTRRSRPVDTVRIVEARRMWFGPPAESVDAATGSSVMTAPSQSLDFWNSLLQNSRTVPDYESWAGRYAALSRAAVSRYGEPERIAVGPHEDQAIWHTPCGRASHRFIFIHGGYWRAYGARDFAFPVAAAAAANASFYNVDYRLMPHVGMGDVVEDAVVACEQAMEGAQRTVIVGHSAGGHLAAEVAMRAHTPPSAVLAISGLFDLVPLRKCFIQDEISLTADDVAHYSPHTRAAQARCPIHLAAGAEETVEFRRQSAAFYDALYDAERPTSLTFVGDHNHSSVVTELGEPAAPLTRQIRALLND